MANNNNNYKLLSSNTFSRKFGHKIHPADPYLNGYFYIRFDNDALFDKVITKMTQMFGVSNHPSTSTEMKSILTATCTQVSNVPGGTLGKVTYQGQGGIKYAVAGNADYGDSVSLVFTEFSGLPIFKIFSAWTQLMRDHSIGTSSDGLLGDNYTKDNYSGVLYYWTTRPDGLTPEFFVCYEGVFPLVDPQEAFSSNVADASKVEHTINFNVDYIWIRPWVLSQINTFLKPIGEDRGEIYDYIPKTTSSNTSGTDNVFVTDLAKGLGDLGDLSIKSSE